MGRDFPALPLAFDHCHYVSENSWSCQRTYQKFHSCTYAMSSCTRNDQPC